MKILEELEVTLTFDDMAKRVRHHLPKGNDDRSPGAHLSGILKYLAVEGGIMKDLGDTASEALDPKDKQYPLIMALGIAWEEFCVGLYPEIAWQPGEQERDGVFGTPDGISDIESIDTNMMGSTRDYDEPIDIGQIEEFKYTTKKLQSVTNIWWYIRQGMGYCAMMGVNHIRYHICFARGDYAARQFPVYMRSLVYFSDEEIEKFWSTIVKYKDRCVKEK